MSHLISLEVPKDREACMIFARKLQRHYPKNDVAPVEAPSWRSIFSALRFYQLKTLDWPGTGPRGGARCQ